MPKAKRRPKFRGIRRASLDNLQHKQKLTQSDEEKSFNKSQSFHDAQLLMHYAGAHGVDVDSKILSGVAHACELFRTGKLSGEDEARFIVDYTALAKAVYPVTARSVKSCIFEEKSQNFLLQTRVQTAADRTLKTYRFYGFLALFILVAIQSYWVVGGFLLANLIREAVLSGKPLRIRATKPKFPLPNESVLNGRI